MGKIIKIGTREVQSEGIVLEALSLHCHGCGKLIENDSVVRLYHWVDKVPDLSPYCSACSKELGNYQSARLSVDLYLTFDGQPLFAGVESATDPPAGVL